MQKKRSGLTDELDDDVSPDYVPNKRRPDGRILRKTTQPSSVYTQPDQKVRGTGPEAPWLFRLQTGPGQRGRSSNQSGTPGQYVH